MRFRVQMPARVNVLGNPSDANEGAHRTISAAIDLHGEMICEEAEVLTFEFLDGPVGSIGKTISRCEVRQESDFAYGGDFDLFKAAVKILRAHSPEFQEVESGRSPKMAFRSAIPRQSGLGGSTVLLLLALEGLVHFHRLDRRRHNLYFLAELAQRAEERELGITCGYADRYVPLFGDIAYIDYRGKLYHEPLYQEPLATYEKLGAFVDELPLVVAYTGVEHDSGDVHGPMRRRYLEEYGRVAAGSAKDAPLVSIMQSVGDLAWRGKIALLERDWARFGTLMNENHRLVDEMMRTCGFPAGAGDVNNELIQAALDAGALGAKLTGAGGGGSVFVLTRPGEESAMADVLRRRLERGGHGQSQVFLPTLDREGVVTRDLGA